MTAPRTRDVRTTVGEALRSAHAAIEANGPPGVLLAVSGGRDSMVLLHAAAAGARGAVRAVATFDHGTGPHATAAVALVVSTARALGVPVMTGTAERVGRTEAAWRDARWRFLRACAREAGATVVATAHTGDDQRETVVMRAMRGAETRGLAALDAPAPGIVRPLLTVSRAEVAAYAEVHGVTWVEDPSNADRRHLRVRVRADLLPALDRRAPLAADQMLALAAAAADHRAGVEDWVTRLCLDDRSRGPEWVVSGIMNESLRAPSRRSPRVLVATIERCDAGALALFWPAFAARAGVRLDRRAIARLVAYTPNAAARVRDGTVQPAQIALAGLTERESCDRAGTPSAVHAPMQHVVSLEYASDVGPDGASQAGRAWQFAVRVVAARVGGRSWRGGAPVV